MAEDTILLKERRGLALPALRNQGGYFASKSPHDTAWGDLLLSLFTPIGGRCMKRGFGSGLYDILFEPNVAENQPVIDMMIRSAAERGAPQVVLDLVDIQVATYGPQIKIAFHLVTDDTTVTKLVQLNREGVIRTLAARSA
jgi:phage baseplate assembly protein W